LGCSQEIQNVLFVVSPCLQVPHYRHLRWSLERQGEDLSSTSPRPLNSPSSAEMAAAMRAPAIPAVVREGRQSLMRRCRWDIDSS
jgi:hypothetical protein